MFYTNQTHTRMLCWLLAILMLFTPGSRVLAQVEESDDVLLADPAIVPVPDVVDTPLDLTYLLPQSCVVLSMRPQAILSSPLFKMLPIEVLQAASVQQTGLDPLQLDRLFFCVEPPVAGPPDYALMGSFRRQS